MSIHSVYLSMLLLFASCASNQPREDTQNNWRRTVVQNAERTIGSSYQYAGKGPKKFDCSGLVNYVYKSIDCNVAGSSASISKMANQTKFSSAKSGDLIFFRKQGRVFHVSIIVENTGDELWVIHSTSSQGVVKQDVLASQYWREKMYKVISLEDLKQ